MAMDATLMFNATRPGVAPCDLAGWLDLLEALGGRMPPGWALVGIAGSSLEGDDAAVVKRLLVAEPEASGPFERRLAAALLALSDCTSFGREDLSSALFLHAPDPGEGAACTPRMLTYECDCVRSAVGMMRAHSGRLPVRLVLVDECDDEMLPARHGELYELSGWEQNMPIMRVRVASDAARMACLSLCEAGGVLRGGGVDPVGLWALRASRHLRELRAGRRAGGEEGGEGGGEEGGEGRVRADADAILSFGFEVRGFVPWCELEASRARLPVGSAVRLVGWTGEGDQLATEPMLDAMSSGGGEALAAARRNLAGCPPVLWINLDRQEGRRRSVERQLDALGVSLHRRVRAVDGWDAAQLARRVPRLHPSGTPAENACTASHLLAMARYLREFPEEPWVIVAEDDVLFELAHLWREPLRAYLERATAEHPGWRVMQLGPIACNEADIRWPHPLMSPDRAVPRIKDNWFGAVAYAVTREAAADYVAWYVRAAPPPAKPVIGGRSVYGPQAQIDTTTNNLNTNRKVARQEPECVDLGELVHDDCEVVHAENVIYSGRGALTLTLPLLSFAGTDSDINQCNPFCHSLARGYLWRFWTQAPARK